MSDDKTKSGPRDASRISLSEDYEVRSWTENLASRPSSSHAPRNRPVTEQRRWKPFFSAARIEMAAKSPPRWRRGGWRLTALVLAASAGLSAIPIAALGAGVRIAGGLPLCQTR